MSHFVFNPDRVITWPCTVNLPVSGGKTETFEIDVEFLLLDEDQMKNPDDADLLKHIKGWGKMDQPNGKSLPFNQKNLKAILKVPYIARAIGLGLVNASMGAAEKNS